MTISDFDHIISCFFYEVDWFFVYSLFLSPDFSIFDWNPVYLVLNPKFPPPPRRAAAAAPAAPPASSAAASACSAADAADAHAGAAVE